MLLLCFFLLVRDSDSGRIILWMFLEKFPVRFIFFKSSVIVSCFGYVPCSLEFFSFHSSSAAQFVAINKVEWSLLQYSGLSMWSGIMTEFWD